MDLVEIVGRALAAADGEDYMEDHARYDRRARAAIEAMREPTPEMKRVLTSAAKYGTEANGDLWPGKLMGELIDAALTPAQS